MTNASPPAQSSWPTLPPLGAWQDTLDTLHLWTQVVGKIRLAQTPRINHWWNATLYVTCRGLSTSPMPHGARHFHIDFDFVEHALHVGDDTGARRSFALTPMSVAAFYRRVMYALDELGLAVDIWPVPVETETAVPFAEDTEHASYDAEAVERFWRALAQVDRVFTDFRARFVGKSSPSHFFWGAFDLAVTRFSGREAPQHPGGIPNVGDQVMHEAYSHERHSAASGRARGWARRRSTRTPIPSPTALRRRRSSRAPPPTTRTSASLCCRTRQCALPTTRTPLSSPSCNRLTRRPPTTGTGTGPRWSIQRALDRDLRDYARRESISNGSGS